MCKFRQTTTQLAKQVVENKQQHNQMVKQKNEVGSMRKYIEASSTLNDCETDT